MTAVASCIYEGRVRHRRMAPVAHAFNYGLFMLYLDLDELATIFDQHPLWTNEGHGLARFRRRDHLKGQVDPSIALSEAVRDLVAAQCGVRPAGPIRLLTHLEYFRYRFNPVSFYFVWDAADERVETIIAEINNTPWGEQHCYVLTPDRDEAGVDGKHRFRFAKDFHISPFMGMDTDYDWFFSDPRASLGIHMDNFRAGEKFFDATMTLRRTELSRRALTRVLVQYPMMTLKVIGAIHWQALRLWLKRCPYYPHPKQVPAARGAGHAE